MKPIRFGSVHGLSGSPARVSGGGPPDRSKAQQPPGESVELAPQVRGGLRGAVEGERPLLLPPAHLRLELAARHARFRPSSRSGPRGARRRRTSRPCSRRGRRDDPRPGRGSSLVAPRRPARAPRPGFPSADQLDVPRRDRARPRIPCSSANCSTAAAAMRAGPMPYDPIQIGCRGRLVEVRRAERLR